MGTMLRTAAVVALLLAATSIARAQAPGEMEPSAAPPPPPPGFVCAGAAPIDVMANRWAVGLGLGSLSLAPKDSPDAKTDYAIGELSIRFRATYHLELEAAFGGGRQQQKDGSQGNLEAHTGVLAARWRFAPSQHWNWWLMGGVGGVQVAPHGSTDQQFKDTERPMGEFGIGLERRFQQFALHVELRAVGVGPRNDNSQTAPQPVKQTMTTNPPAPPAMTTDDHLQGGQLTIGASYYF
jgi:hypothetical protein